MFKIFRDKYSVNHKKCSDYCKERHIQVPIFKMRVLYAFPGQIVGGAERRTYEICTGLNKLGCKAIVACGRGPSIEIAKLSNIQCYFLPIKKDKLDIWTALRTILHLIKIIKYNDIDILVTFRRTMAFCGHVATRVVSIPHIYMNVCNYDDKLWLRWTGDFTIAISQTCLENAVNSLKASPDRCQLIYRGVEVPPKLLSRHESRRRLCIPNETPLIGIVARLDSRKGHRFLLQAMQLVRKRFNNATVLIVGDGEEKANLESQKNAIGLPNKSVIFLGERRDVWDILPALDVCVLPSVQMEGLGSALLEAAACGIPLIGTTVGGISEIIEDGWNGFLVAPRDINALSNAVLSILGNPRLAIEMGENSKKMARNKFSKEREILEHLNIYRTVIAHHNKFPH